MRRLERTSGNQKASLGRLLEGQEKADVSHENQEAGVSRHRLGAPCSLRGSEEEGGGGRGAPMPGDVTMGFIKGT